METRSKLWRRKQGFRLFKARMVRLAASERSYRFADGSVHVPLRWFELAGEHWTVGYRTTGTPCSCPLCRGERYDRRAYRRETRRIIGESDE